MAKGDSVGWISRSKASKVEIASNLVKWKCYLMVWLVWTACECLYRGHLIKYNKTKILLFFKYICLRGCISDFN